MDEAEIKAIIAKLKAADWDAETISPEVASMLMSIEFAGILHERTKSPDEAIRTEAAWIVKKFQEAYVAGRFLKVDTYQYRYEVRRAEILNGTDIQRIIANLHDPDHQIRHLATEQLGELGDPVAVPHLIEVLKDENREVYEGAALALCKIAQEHYLAELVPYLISDDVRLRMVAAYVLGSKSGKDAVRGLIDLVRVGIRGDKREFEHALYHLRQISQPAIDDLIAALNEQKPELRRLAVLVLGPIVDMRVLPHLITMMGDEDEQTYEMATYWVSSRFGEAAIPLLEDALNSENARLRENAAKALDKIRQELQR